MRWQHTFGDHPVRILRTILRPVKRILKGLFRVEIGLYFKSNLQSYRYVCPIEPEVSLKIGTIGEIEDAARMIEDETGAKKWKAFSARLHHGAQCFVAKSGSMVIGSNWLAVNSVSEGEGHQATLKEDEVWCLDAYTSTHWRGRGIHPALLSSMMSWSRDHGFRTAFTEANLRNYRSWKAHRKLKWYISGIEIRLFVPKLNKKYIAVIYGSRYPFPHSRSFPMAEWER
jgi:hypothetical protein